MSDNIVFIDGYRNFTPRTSLLIGRIRYAVQVLGWSQASAAREFRASPSFVCNVVSYRSRPEIRPSPFDPDNPLYGLN